MSAAVTGRRRPAICFVRHGESLANVADRARERRPDDGDRLSDRGWAQARELGGRLRGERLEAIIASPMIRAQETAAGIAEVLDLPVTTDPDLFEVRQSDAFFAAQPDGHARHATLRWMPAADPTWAEEGAESFADVIARVHRVRRRLHDAAHARRVVAVSHFGFLHFFLGVTLFGDGFTPEMVPGLYRMGHANTGITIFEHRPDRVMDGIPMPGWTLTTWNDQAHL